MIQAALIGAGSRGMHSYASYALKNPHEIKFIAVAEENEKDGRNLQRTMEFQKKCNFRLGKIY